MGEIELCELSGKWFSSIHPHTHRILCECVCAFCIYLLHRTHRVRTINVQWHLITAMQALNVYNRGANYKCIFKNPSSKCSEIETTVKTKLIIQNQWHCLSIDGKMKNGLFRYISYFDVINTCERLATLAQTNKPFQSQLLHFAISWTLARYLICFFKLAKNKL